MTVVLGPASGSLSLLRHRPRRDRTRRPTLRVVTPSAQSASTSSACVGCGGLAFGRVVHTASATYGDFGTELDVIAAVVLGGTSLHGGRGSVARTMVGVVHISRVASISFFAMPHLPLA